MTRVTALLVLAGIAANTNANVIAGDDLDGNTVNLITSSIPALDGGAGDYFGIGSRNAWPQGTPPGTPFSLADDSVVDYSGGGVFPSDNEGVWGQNSNFDNNYFAISDTREWTAAQLQASWTFDVSGASNLALNIDLGGVSSASSGGYSADTTLRFYASFDGNPEIQLFGVFAEDNTGQYTTRPMDSGGASGGGRLLHASSQDYTVLKLLAEDGSVAGNTYLDKSVAAGPGAGLMDTFRVAFPGSGSQLTIRVEANVPFEAVAMDNVSITPAPAGLALLGLGGLVATRRRR